MGLGFAELMVRLFTPHPHYADLVVPDAHVGYITKPGGAGRYSNRFGEFDTEIRLNHEGFRDTDHPLQKPANMIRIAILGDSLTEAEQVEEPQTFVRRFETLLNEKPSDHGNRTIECMNFGIDGYDTQQELLCYEYYVRKYKPDVVILAVYVHNDFQGNLFYETDEGFGRPYFKLNKGKLEKVEANMEVMQKNYAAMLAEDEDHWYRRSHLYNKAYDAINYLIERSKNKGISAESKLDLHDPQSVEYFWSNRGYGRYHYYVDPPDDYVKRVDQITKLLMTRLKNEVQADGALFTVVLIGTKENFEPDKWPQLVKKYPDLEQWRFDWSRPFDRTAAFLPDVAAQGNILDMRPFLRKGNEEKPIAWRHDFHHTPWGNEVVARAMADWFRSTVFASLKKQQKKSGVSR